jgi:hypothetical protein
MLLAPGLSVHAFAIYGVLADDGAVDLVGLAISTAPATRRLGAGSSAGITAAGRRRGREPRRTTGAARCGRRGRSAAPRFWHPGDHACAPRADRHSATGWHPGDHAHRRCRHVRARRPCPRATARPDGRASGHGHRASGPGPPAPVAGALPPCRGYGGVIDRGVVMPWGHQEPVGLSCGHRPWPTTARGRPAIRQHSASAPRPVPGLGVVTRSIRVPGPPAFWRSVAVIRPPTSQAELRDGMSARLPAVPRRSLVRRQVRRAPRGTLCVRHASRSPTRR